MSSLIDLFHVEIAISESFKAILKSIFKSNLFVCKNIVDQGNQITFFVKASQNAYWLSTIWTFQLYQQNCKLEIKFYNKEQSDLLRAYNSRMKFQISLLIRAVNIQLIPNSCFFIETQSGVLKLSHVLVYSKQFENQKQFYLQNVLKIFWIIRRFNQLILFIQPHINVKQAQQKQKLELPYQRVNKIKCLLKNTQNTRYNLSAPFFDLMRAKAENNIYAYGVIERIGLLYMENVNSFQLSQIGLEDVDQFRINQKIHEKELMQKTRHEKAKTTPPGNGQKDIDKILYGLISIKPIRNESIDSSDNQQNPNPEIEQIGSHCLVQADKFVYYIVDTIHGGTISYITQQSKPLGRKKQGQLVFKNCKSENQASINSFRNQLAFLKYVRDMSSPFIAKYYLLVKQTWNEKDTIYMHKYQQNVYELIEKRKTLTIKAKLQLSYKISKGLCFLYSKQVVHRDFKPHNIVVDSYLTPKIIDFGSCASHYKNKQIKAKFKPYDQRLLKTKYFQISYSNIRRQHPQLAHKFTQKQYDQHPLFDIYSFGKLLNYIFFGSVYIPIPEMLRNEPFYQVLQNVLFLIQACVRIDPDDRPCFGEITTFIGALNDIINIKSTIEKQEGDKNKNTQKQKEKTKQQKKNEQKLIKKQLSKKPN